MSFTYGNFYGLTGVLALYADPAQISKMLQAPSISIDARESLIALYQELYAIKMVFDPSNTDEKIPHASITVDKNSEEAAKYLRGYNNYLAYQEQQAKLYTSDNNIDDIDVEDMNFSSDTLASSDPSESVDKTAMFVDIDDIDLAVDDDSETNAGLDLDGVGDLDLNVEADAPNDLADSEPEEVTLFSTYNQVCNVETGTIDLVKWGELYPASYDSAEQQAQQLSWGAAMKRMKKDAKEPIVADFIRQRKALPTIVANCTLSPVIKSSIRNAMGSDVNYIASSFEEDFSLKLLDSIHRKAIEPVRISLEGENAPKLDLLLNLLKTAINAPSNAYIKRFGISMSELALWNTRTPYVINSMIINFVDSVLDVSTIQNRNVNDVQNTITHLLADCNYLLGTDNTDVKTGFSKESIEELYASCEMSPVMTNQICEAFLRDKFTFSNTEIAEIAEMLTKFMSYGINSNASDNERLNALITLLASQENLIFVYHAYSTVNSAVQQLASELIRVYTSCLAEDEDPLGIYDISLTDTNAYAALQNAMLSLFKGFVMRTGICGLSLCYFDKMYAMTCQMGPAIISTPPVKFNVHGYERAYNAVLLFRGYLASILRRIDRMCKEA